MQPEGKHVLSSFINGSFSSVLKLALLPKSYLVIAENTGRQMEEDTYRPPSQRYRDYSSLFDVLIFVIVCHIFQSEVYIFCSRFSH